MYTIYSSEITLDKSQLLTTKTLVICLNFTNFGMEKQRYFYNHKSQVAKSIGLVDSNNGSESWTLCSKKEKYIEAFEMWCY